MPTALPRRTSFLTLLLSGLLLMAATGCGSSNPNISAAEDALDNENYEQALQSVETEIQANPQNAEAYRLKGDILYQQAQSASSPDRRSALIGEMMTAYDQAIEINPELEEVIGTLQLRQAYGDQFRMGAQAYNRADSLGDPDMYREAAGYFESAAQIRPDSSRALTLAANSYLNAGDYEQAVDPLQRTVDMGGADAAVYTTLGQLYLQQQRNDEAITVLEEGTNDYPDNADLQSQLLNAYVRSGDTERAMTAYEEAIRDEPQNATYRANYGSMLLRQNRFEQAIEQLERAAEMDSDNLNALYNLGVAYRNQAVAVNDSIRTLDERRSTEAEQMSQQEMQQLDEEISTLAEERTELFRRSIEPLQEARRAYQQNASETNLSEEQICRPLFTAYMQTNQQDQAQAVEDCANFQDSGQ